MPSSRRHRRFTATTPRRTSSSIPAAVEPPRPRRPPPCVSVVSWRILPTPFPSPLRSVSSTWSSFVAVVFRYAPPCAIAACVVSGDHKVAAPPFYGAQLSFRVERARSRALARPASPAIAVAVARYRARARAPRSNLASGPRCVASGAQLAVARVLLARVHLAAQCQCTPDFNTNTKLLQTCKIHRKINTTQKNTNEISKCSVK